MPDGKQQTPRAAPEEVRAAGAAGWPRWAARRADRARWLGAAVVAWRWLQHERGRATLRPCAPKYALRGSASVANSSAVWAQPPRDASAPAVSLFPLGPDLLISCVLRAGWRSVWRARRGPGGSRMGPSSWLSDPVSGVVRLAGCARLHLVSARHSYHVHLARLCTGFAQRARSTACACALQTANKVLSMRT